MAAELLPRFAPVPSSAAELAKSRSQPLVQAYLDDVDEDLGAFDALFAARNRLAAYHLEQAAEKLIRAVRIHRQLQVPKTHDLLLLLDGYRGSPSREPRPLPDGDPWRERLREHKWLSKFATASGFPTCGGRPGRGPTDEELRRAKAKLAEHLALARRELLGAADGAPLPL